MPNAPALLALSHALPLVTTPHGSRGLLATRTPGAIAIARSSTEFAAALATLLANRSAWSAQRKLAVAHVHEQLGPRRLQRELRRAAWEVWSAP